MNPFEIKYQKIIILPLLIAFCFFATCKSDKGSVDLGGYPTAVGKLIETKCANRGCHDEVSKNGAAGLSMETWDALFNGENTGAVVIPYRPDYSIFSFVINTYPDLGIIVKPTMPYNKPALSRDEVILLQNWIANGAPDRNGKVKFADNTQRKKIYVTNQGCDVVTVFDQETGLPMRYINVGKTSSIESPHMIRVSPDGKYWYVVFSAGAYVQRYKTSDDSFDAEVNVGTGNWNSITISSDSKDAYVVDWSSFGRIGHIDLQTMTLSLPVWQGSNLFDFPHGGALNKTNDTLYCTGQTGNFIYKIPVADPASAEQVSLDGNPAVTSSSLDVHEISFSPDFTKYFVTCQRTNEVRIMQTSDDQLLKVIPVGLYPQELSVSRSSKYLFVSCPEDTITFPGFRGSVAIIDYQSNTLVSKVFTGFQPHGLVVDDAKKMVYVANRNVTTKGPAPHHLGVCGGRNGYVTFIDMTTFELAKLPDGGERRIELSVDPYSVALR